MTSSSQAPHDLKCLFTGNERSLECRRFVAVTDQKRSHDRGRCTLPSLCKETSCIFLSYYLHEREKT